MNVKISSQPKAKAIVPMFVRTAWPDHDLHYSSITRVTDAETIAQRHLWSVIWGLYKFTDPMGRTNTVEGRCLLSRYWHDFCGGLLMSSATVDIHENTFNQWDGHSVYASWGLHNETRFSNLPDSVPSLHDFTRAKALTHNEALAIMRRSLIAGVIARGIQLGKLGVLAMDRADWAPRTRTIMQEARNLTWVYGGAVNMPTIDHSTAWGERLALNPTVTQYTPERGTSLVGVRAQVRDDWMYTNRNSGRRVGPVLLTFEPTNEYVNPYRDEDYDEDEAPGDDNGRDDHYPEWPQSIITAQTRKDYVRLVPSRLFHNG